MDMKNIKRIKIILIIYLTATLALLLLGYSVRKPGTTRQEFPFSICYSYQGETETISDVYVAEYVSRAKYLGDASVAWSGYIRDRSRLESDYYRIAENGGEVFSIDLNIVPGYLMGDPGFADAARRPTGAFHSSEGTNEITVTDPGELLKMGFSIVSWEYPEPIGNTFSFGGVSMSSEATIYTAAMAVAALLACMILIKRDREKVYRPMDKLSIALDLLTAIVAFPFIFAVSTLSEITADTSFLQQVLYFMPALTVIGIGASVTARRMGCSRFGFWCKFVGPGFFALLLLLDRQI